jgi:metal-responsive CopG/Arc/MetJ family transcriptional regulator
MPCIKTAVSFDEQIFKHVKRLSRKQGISRSRFISHAIQAYIQQLDKEQMIQQITKAYNKPDPNEQRLSAAAKSRFSNIVEGTW